MLTEEQLALRMHTVGSSEIAAVCALNPYRSSHDVYCEKLGLLSYEGNVKTRMGERVEHAVAEEYVLETGAELAHFGTIVHPKHAWMSATPDRVVRGTRRIVEIKCVGFRSAYHWGTDPDAIPDYYRPQVEWQMDVCDADETHVAAWIGGSDFRIYTIKRDRALGDLLRKIGHQFWVENVLARVPPRVDESLGARRMLNAMFPRNSGKILAPDEKASTLVSKLFDAQRAVKEAEAAEDRIKNQLRELAEDADGFESRDWKVSWKADRNGKRSFKVKTKEEKAA